MTIKIEPHELPALRRAVVSDMRGNLRAFIAEYRQASEAGRFYCNDILGMVRHYRASIHSAFRGECDNHVWMVQRMLYLKTGECFAILP